jgi:hypothetical protein
MACPLLKAAAYYQVPELIERCENFLGETLTTDNVVDVLNMASENGSSRLEICCSEFIGRHVQDILAKKSLERLRPETLRKLLEQSILPGSLVAQAGVSAGAAPGEKVPEMTPSLDTKKAAVGKEKEHELREEEEDVTPTTESKQETQKQQQEDEPTDIIPSKASFTINVPVDVTRT